MASKRKGALPVLAEAPGVSPQPEIKPLVEPPPPATPAEQPHVQPEEVPGEISPYDFPPPGEGLFPEIF